MIESLTKKEEIFFREYGLVILKPDSIELYLENLFIRDFEYLGLQTEYRRLLKLTKPDIKFIYPEWATNKSKFRAIAENMTAGQSMLLLLRSTGIEVEDLHSYIKNIKGHADQPGLRRKYIHIFEEELQSLYPDRKQFLRELNKNRIHSPENACEALHTLIYLWPRLNINGISSTLPRLCDIMSSRLALSTYVP